MCSSNKHGYCTPWQDFGSYKKAKHLLDTGLMSDCSFLVGDERNAKRFDCHKIILISASPVFETMFCSSFKEASNTNSIPIPDAEPEDFRLFLEFLYDPCQSSAKLTYDESCSEYSDGEGFVAYSDSDELRVERLSEKFENYNFETLKNLLYLGDKYMIKSLGKQCCLALSQLLGTALDETVLRIFELAITTEHKGLARKSALHFEREFTLVPSQVIYDLDASVLCEFLKYLEETSSRDVLEVIRNYIERNSLNLEANDGNEYEYSICKSCENPYKRQKKEHSKHQDSDSDTERQQKRKERQCKKSMNSCDTAKSHASHKKQRLDKANNVDGEPPSTSKSNATSINSSSKPISSTDRERNLDIIKQLYESVNFNDMDPIEFLKAAKKPGLSEYLSYRRKYEILEKLCKHSQRNSCYLRKWK